MAEYKRALSQREADRCENAREEKCTCRCNGTLHGAGRAGSIGGMIPEAFFQSLPADDPHHMPTAEERDQRRKASYEARLARNRDRTASRYTALARMESSRYDD